ncbi:hypothetical protein [Agromyces sp. PvR057]|uniref:hypothetical protein n=1 Tax=Agromyces sp. PvR057 TaxID=3156403 RepID=UPI003399D2E2
MLLVLDPLTGEVPERIGGSSVAFTSSGLAIGTVSEFDGETEVHIEIPSDAPGGEPASLVWEGELETSGRLALMTIYNEALLEVEAAPKVRVQVWANDESGPDVIWIALV